MQMGSKWFELQRMAPFVMFILELYRVRKPAEVQEHVAFLDDIS